MARHRKNPAEQHERSSQAAQTTLRIVGGDLRGRKLLYTGHIRTRPMKDRTREAIFNLLGLDVRGKHAVDLFAGTGALGFEALSRGAGRATFVEQHFPTARVVQQNAALLGVTERCRVESGNVFLWATEAPDATGEPWLVFCSPPYAFFVDRRQEMMDLLDRITQRAPPDSLLVVESDARFDTSLLPDTLDWDVRQYPPAVVAIGHKAPPDSPQD